MDMMWTSLLWAYAAGLAVFLLVVDEPLLPRLGIALIWPVPILIFAGVVLILVLTAALNWWPLGVVLVALGGLAAWVLA